MALAPQDPDAPDFTRRYVNLADARLGAQAVAASDEFFAAKERMLNPEPAEFIPGKYDANGKWMDGWESRRKRRPGHDWCVVRLARTGTVHGLDLDTSHFTGNYPPAASVEGCVHEAGEPDARSAWFTLLPPTDLQGNRHHYLAVPEPKPCSHLRVNLYPDGGLARLRAYAAPRFIAQADADGWVDLASALQGGVVVAANNQHFGLASRLLLPDRSTHMGDGWETRRRREPGNDWCIMRLGHPGQIESIEVDTAHFKGNFPDRCSLQGAFVPEATDASVVTQSMFWPVLLPEQPLHMDHRHTFLREIALRAPVTHVRFNIHPDGGVARLRLRGRPA